MNVGYLQARGDAVVSAVDGWQRRIPYGQWSGSLDGPSWVGLSARMARYYEPGEDFDWAVRIL
jgi:hypothetical protein